MNQNNFANERPSQPDPSRSNHTNQCVKKCLHFELDYSEQVRPELLTYFRDAYRLKSCHVLDVLKMTRNHLINWKNNPSNKVK